MKNENWEVVWEIIDQINDINGVNAKVKTINSEHIVYENCVHYNNISCLCTLYGDINVHCDISCADFEDKDDV